MVHNQVSGGHLGTVVQAGVIHGDVIVVGALDERTTYRSFLRSSFVSRADLFRGWLAVAAESPDVQVPSAVADVDSGIMELLNELRELCLMSPEPIATAARDVYTAMLSAANTQFDLHRQNYGSSLRLSALDHAAFQHHTRRVDEVLDTFVEVAHFGRNP